MLVCGARPADVGNNKDRAAIGAAAAGARTETGSVIGLMRERSGIRPAGVIVAQCLAPNKGIRIAANHSIA